jgi:ketosteroid isomerase-like protein
MMLTILAAIGLVAPASAQKPHEDLRQQLEGIAAAYTDAENRTDAAAVASLYTNDGEVVSPT